METERPLGITILSTLLLVLCAIALGVAVAVLFRALPLSAGAFLLMGAMEQMGPLAFALYAVLTSTLAWGLWRRKNWSRRATLLLAIAGIALAVPSISSAVVDTRTWAIVREGLQIIVRVVIVYYLSQEPVRAWFAS